MVAMAHPWKHPKTGMYYLRKSVPEDVRPILKKREIKTSLKTKDPRKAKELFIPELARAEALINSARKGEVLISSKQASAFAGAWLRRALAEDEALREAGSFPAEEQESIGGSLPYSLSLDHIADAAESGKGLSLVRADIQETLEAHGLAISEEQLSSHPELTDRFLEAKHRYFRILQQRTQGKWHTPDLDRDYPQLSLDSLRPQRIISGTSFETLWEAWLQETTVNKKTQDEYEKALTEFEEVNGKLAVEAVSKEHVRAFKDKLIKGKSLKPATINKKLTAIKSILSFAMDNGYISANPAHGFKVAEDGGGIDSRLPFSADELKRIFSTPVYTTNERPIGGRGETAYWLPLLALYTGARLEELGKLTCEDIQEHEGVPYVELTSADKGSKKRNRGHGRRIVPIHSDLLNRGFLAYVQSISKSDTAPLFPELNKANQYGQTTQAWSSWWHRYFRKEAHLTDSKKTFHSFRHTFIQACREHGVSEEKRKAMVGHSNRDVSFTYGGWTSPRGLAYPFSPKSLRGEIEKLTINGLH